MPNLEPDKQDFLLQLWAGAGVLLVSAGAAVYRLLNPKKPHPDNVMTLGHSEELVRLAKENADLRAKHAEDTLRREFDEKIVDLRADFYQVLESNRIAATGQFVALNQEVQGVKLQLAGIVGMLDARLPPR